MSMIYLLHTIDKKLGEELKYDIIKKEKYMERWDCKGKCNNGVVRDDGVAWKIQLGNM